MLKAIVAWMDRKWPDRVVVTQADYDGLKASINSLQIVLNEEKVLERLKRIESEINKFNATMGLSATLGKMGAFQR